MVSDASRKKAAAAGTSSKAAAATASKGVEKVSDGIGSLHISDRTCTGVLRSLPQSSDIHVPISTLEEKVVGLYFYRGSEDFIREVTPILVKIYHELNDREENFEIVMINLHFIEDYDDDKELFEKDFKCMAWLALPFKDQTCRTLLQWFTPYSTGELEDILIIVGPGGNIFYRNGAEVLWLYGIKAYPFTLKRVAEMEVATLKACMLESVLAKVDVKFECAKDGAKIQVFGLVGKTIIMFIGQEGCSRSCELLQKLVHWHDRSKIRDVNIFEVIFVSIDEDLPSYNNFCSVMPWPWLALPLDVKRAEFFTKTFKVGNYLCIIAFGSDSKILTKNELPLLQDCTVNECDLYSDLFDEVHRQIKDRSSIIERGCFPYYDHGSVDIDRFYDDDDTYSDSDGDGDGDDEDEESIYDDGDTYSDCDCSDCGAESIYDDGDVCFCEDDDKVEIWLL